MDGIRYISCGRGWEHVLIKGKRGGKTKYIFIFAKEEGVENGSQVTSSKKRGILF